MAETESVKKKSSSKSSSFLPPKNSLVPQEVPVSEPNQVFIPQSNSLVQSTDWLIQTSPAPELTMADVDEQIRLRYPNFSGIEGGVSSAAPNSETVGVQEKANVSEVGDKFALETDEMVAQTMKMPTSVSQGILAPIESVNSIKSLDGSSAIQTNFVDEQLGNQDEQGKEERVELNTTIAESTIPQPVQVPGEQMRSLATGNEPDFIANNNNSSDSEEYYTNYVVYAGEQEGTIKLIINAPGQSVNNKVWKNRTFLQNTMFIPLFRARIIQRAANGEITIIGIYEPGEPLRLAPGYEIQSIKQLFQPNSPETLEPEFFPWSGEITGAPSVALNENSPLDVRQANTIADLKQGTPVLVIGRVVNEKQQNWLRVEVLDDSERTGYVSGELVKRREQLTEIELRRSFVLLKKAETASANNGTMPSEGEIAWAQGRLRLVRNFDADRTTRYEVNPQTHQVSFNQSNKEQIKVINITDFILFVEAVERQYPHAKPGDVASEIREIWFSDENWKLLSAGTGISTFVGAGRGRIESVDIESKPNPIAVMFDIGGALGGKQEALPKLIVTRLGMTDITHVMAGIDVAINGMAQKPNVLDPSGRAKYQILEEASGGNTHDFATWSGDLGQAYGDYLRRLYVIQETSLTLGIVFGDKANPEALRGDIHGYIAALVSQEIQQDGYSPTNNQPQRVSDILRNLYLVEEPNSAQRKSYRYYFEKVAGKAGLDLYNFILDRTIRFAKPWYAKDVYNALSKPLIGESETAFKKRVLAIRARLDVEVPSSGLDNFNAVNAINKLIEDFEYKHQKNEQLAEKNNKIGEYVKSFIKMIDSEVSI
ncbi:MAG TPA: hypothetical protein DEG17_10860 [Cyanobacteria bacterium UBA11149]|nr:hypothetical protein [Cyanobacteria bacterium UBA11367]HBE57272.1 hypothetical protein [Cyanobacteria bacterium UBA11366]HBK66189.1 hypothetical protein [Cyanobacteria bacterium UBA11166]HBR75319.1 hypothetical protein [Cyanobacteria bacterium UBA11159]HBS70298.1 hypothetical protein [Cyanobacteria bacterium UBA11153]HBW89348.1 hypothetical protein [Cyanobacteria bacterium UBA11149]HCA97537.1 hypothetical protein [Cyanobacteria bacterium UBA9226]